MERTVASGNGHRSSAPHPIDALVGVAESGGGGTERSGRGETEPMPENREAQQAEDLGRPVQTSS